MPTGRTRDDSLLREGLDRWVAAHPDLVPGAGVPAVSGGVGAPRGGPQIVEVTRAEGGMSNETLLVDLGAAHPGMVIRLPPLEASFIHYSLGPQAAVQNAVAAAGVPAPSPAVVVEDESWIGCEFLVMPKVDGRIPGPAPVFDQWLTGMGPQDRRRVHDGLIETLAAVHDVDWEPAGLGSVLTVQTLDQTLDEWSRYVEWAGEGEPLPSLSTALTWCRRHMPAEGSESVVVLCWGDARLGNLVFDESLQLQAVLDWDLASLGPAEMDLGWYLGLDYMMTSLFGERLDGFPSHEESVVFYEACRGVTVRDLDWHEVFALVRALAINDRHQRIAGDRRRRQNPMGDVLMERLAAADAVLRRL